MATATLKKEGDVLIENTKKAHAEQLASVKEQNQAALNDFDTETQQIMTDADKVQESALNEQTDYMKMMDSFITSANNRMENQAEENKKSELDEYNARTWGGLTEVAANLINVIGTMSGASPMQVQSHQQEWANRADNLRRQRDAKLENYRNQVDSLRQQKERIQNTFNSENTKRQLNKDSMLSRRLQQKANLKRDYARAEDTLSKDYAKSEEQMAQNLMKLVNSTSKNQSGSGTMSANDLAASLGIKL